MVPLFCTAPCSSPVPPMRPVLMPEAGAMKAPPVWFTMPPLPMTKPAAAEAVAPAPIVSSAVPEPPTRI